ncbi:CPBP family glutamic-type intramembrane protease [Sandarakinorhabdus sp. AAP62]|uniref:CPBP family intramembrane glutamic endopeptidase, BDIM_20840 family n=1 Tax=Sandarakinorhabdus sp. AAP62 TaxID=1248916 RepID=UPI0004784C7B|nr:CPBP family glutamic-type intramembrane protease [Sandarakinorhabdus sp. AAP62]
MNALISLAAVLALLAVAGFGLGLLDRARFSARWLGVAALLVALNDLVLTRGYGLLPDLLGGEWNWQGKILALMITLAIAALPAFGWARCGLTFAQAAGSWRAAWPVAALYCSFFLAIALAFPSGPATSEETAFQLTMPGLAEEPFYRGVLLFALDRAFQGRKRLLGVEWGWGALLSCWLFGMDHAFGYAGAFAGGEFSLDPAILALTAIPSLLAVWLRLRTGSLLLPVLLHNFGNSIALLV